MQLSLDGIWKLRQTDKEKTIDAQVPGCVHLDLMQAGEISDPYYADNEYRTAWVHESDWIYTHLFELDAAQIPQGKAFLVFDGIDTFAAVTLNGEGLGVVDNMYIQHRFEVTKLLKIGENCLQVAISSPTKSVASRVKKDPLITPEGSLPGSIYARKSPSQWGWDWAPSNPTMGIWRSVRMEWFSASRIADVWVRQEHKAGGTVAVTVATELERFADGECAVAVTLTYPDGIETRQDKCVSDKSCNVVFEVSKPQLWWPNGYGAQPLYQVRVELFRNGEAEDEAAKQVGLRTIALEQLDDQWGRSFTFIVNEVRIFCKGANWVPADMFPPRITTERYRKLVADAAHANMNMLRCWGGGWYENECFYDFCDHYGILVWQDFMFSCGQYPVDRAFLANVRKDIEFNTTRLRSRACVALWCGNNEQEWFLAGTWGDERSTEYRANYLKIFHEMIPEIVSSLDPDRTYWPCSPHSGGEPFDDPNSEACGDGHYWDVWHGRLPFTAYRDHYFRFMSEFGFESFPSIETVRAFAPNDQLNATSYVMECHQKNTAGNGLILQYLAQTFRFPKDFENMCYVSQLLQAEAMRYGVEHWRRNRGRCMGTLYWQYNDCWPGASWAGIDYYGRWKALQYFARRFYEPVLLSVCETGHRAKVHVTNDTLSAIDACVEWRLQRLDGETLREGQSSVYVVQESDAVAAELDFSDILTRDTARQSALFCELWIGGELVASCMTSFVPSKHLELPNPKLIVETVGAENTPPDARLYLLVSAKNAARFVTLTIPGVDAIFSDNYFDLAPGESKLIWLEEPADQSALKEVIAFSLQHSY